MTIPRSGGKGNADRIQIPCGQCYPCLANKRAEWAFRIAQEWKFSKTALFVTLTYDNENLPIYFRENEDGRCTARPTLDKRDIQLFLKKLRKVSSFRYFATGEYGENYQRPHYHLIIFNLEWSNKKHVSVYDYSHDLVTKCWGKGSVLIGTVTGASIMYVAKYHILRKAKKRDIKNETRIDPFSIMSLKPGIGFNYLCDQIERWHTDLLRNYVQKEDGYKSRLPRYYRDKMFSKNSKENFETLVDQEITDYNEDLLRKIELERKREQILKNSKQ